MAKRISEVEKKEIIESFIKGNSVETIAKKYNCTKLTISRNLKKLLGEDKYKRIVKEIKLGLISNKLINEKIMDNYKYSNNFHSNKKNDISENDLGTHSQEDIFPQSNFLEIQPLNGVFDDLSQKDLSSISIKSIEFPNVVYMIISSTFELEIKQLKDYPAWQFLPLEDLERNTLEIFHDLKSAKGLCNKNQKVIKVPNTNVFKIVAPILITKGISRIISNDQLIAL